MRKLLIVCLTVLLGLSLFIAPGHAAIEDFTTYTEIDEIPSRITVNATDVEGTFARKDYAYVYKDFGNDYFDDFTHFFDLYMNTSVGSSGLAVVWMLLLGNVKPSDPQADWYDLRNGGNLTLSVDLLRTTSNVLRLGYFDGGSLATNTTTIALDTWYYCNVTRLGTFLELQVYTVQSDRDENTGNNRNAILSLTVSTNTGRYLYAASSYDNGLDATNRWIVARIKHYDLDPAAPVYMYLTAYHTAGGTMRRDNATLANATATQFLNNTLVEYEFIALVNGNNTYSFANWTHGATANISNPYDFSETLTANLSLWCYFEAVVSEDGDSQLVPEKLFTGAAFFGLFVSLPLLILFSKRLR